MLQRFKETPIEFWTAEKDGRILGGLAVMNYDNISAHLIAYITKDGEKNKAGTGLIDWWSRYALKNGFKYLNFGHLRERGETRAWQGYTDFKKKFIDEEIVIKNEYFRFF